MLNNKQIQHLRKINLNEPIRINSGEILTFENSDVAFYADEVIASLDISDLKHIMHYSPYDKGDNWKPKEIKMLYLITKQINANVIKLLELPIPKFLAVSITGMGCSKIEPFVPDYKTVFRKIKEIIDLGFNPDDIVIRIDPLYPGINTPDINKDLIIDIIKLVRESNIKQIYTSVFDIYSHTSKELLSLIDTSVYKNDITDGYTKHANKEYLKSIFQIMSNLITEYSDAEHILCGEFPDVIPTGAKQVGCLNLERIEQTLCVKVIGIKDRTFDDVENNENVVQRENCLCVVTDNGKKVKRQGLSNNQTCFHSCLGCYMKK